MRTKGAAKPATVDAYLARVSDEQRVALQRLRQTILSVIPSAEECISYGMPGFRYDGKVLVWIGAGANHCAFYPGAVIQGLGVDLEGYETSKGTIRFQPDEPLPATLVRKILKARIAQNAAKRMRAR
jgi:uncharacterized protein YdhG (YjbR/CyaY superfamily)